MINEIKMQELKDLFFYTFGIVPLQNYNVVGDGMTDICPKRKLLLFTKIIQSR